VSKVTILGKLTSTHQHIFSQPKPMYVYSTVYFRDMSCVVGARAARTTSCWSYQRHGLRSSLGPGGWRRTGPATAGAAPSFPDILGTPATPSNPAQKQDCGLPPPLQSVRFLVCTSQVHFRMTESDLKWRWVFQQPYRRGTTRIVTGDASGFVCPTGSVVTLATEIGSTTGRPMINH
jgi:hypothetical protein